MKQEQIKIDTQQIEKTKRDLNRLIETINNTTGIEITKEDLQQMFTNDYKITLYLNVLKDVCTKYYLDFETMRTAQGRLLGRYEQYYLMVEDRIRPYRELSNRIKRYDKRLLNYIDVIGNKAVLIEDAENMINDRFTYYTASEKQTQLVKQLKIIQETIKDLNKQGYDDLFIKSCFHRDKEINEKVIYSIVH